MKYIIISLLLIGCQRQPPEIQAVINKLETRERVLLNSTDILKQRQLHLAEDNRLMRINADELKAIIESKGDPVYIVQLKSKKDSFSIDPFDHMADSANAVEFEIPVDRDFYDDCKVGEKVGSGTAWWASTWGDINITVISKRIEARR